MITPGLNYFITIIATNWNAIMSEDTLLRLKETLLYTTLEKREKQEKKGSLLSTKVYDIVGHVSPLLARIPENMPEYTLHDASHSMKVVKIMGEMIPAPTLKNLNSLELTLLILSAFLHDIGMTCDRNEKEEIIKNSPDYAILFKSDIDKYNAYENYKNSNDHRSATFIEDQVFTEYLRRNHVRRSADYISEYLSCKKLELSFKDIPFWKHLIAICDSMQNL